MQKCLLLNATYEPVRIISAQDAVILIVMEDAESVEDSENAYHSAGGLVVVVPSVLRLLEYKKIPVRTRVPVTKRYVLARDNGKCAYCREHACEVDHVIPRSRGGRHTWTNVAASCRPCNSRKADKLLSEIGWSIDEAILYTPKGSLWISKSLVTDYPEWEPFLRHLREERVEV